jgi:hypothetical protein
MRRLIWRSIRRVASGTELWNGNRERWRNLFCLDPQESVIVWAWQHYQVYQARYGAARRDPAYQYLTFLTVTSPAGMRSLLASMAQPAAGG